MTTSKRNIKYAKLGYTTSEIIIMPTEYKKFYSYPRLALICIGTLLLITAFFFFELRVANTPKSGLCFNRF